MPPHSSDSKDDDDTLNAVISPGRRPRKVVGSLQMAPPPPTSALESTMDVHAMSTITSNGVRMSRATGLSVEGQKMRGVSREDLTLTKHLGAGVSSVVKLGRHRRTREKYAVKIFNVLSKDKRDMFFKEVRVLFSLADCKALVGFKGAYLDETDRVGVVLEFMDAGSLETLLEKQHGGIPERFLASITHQVLTGLDYLHSRENLHRDIKPGNVLVNRNGNAKLADFGITRELHGDDAATTCVGTFRYMSPERIVADDYSFPSDVWSIGMVLLESASGKPVFSLGCTPVDLNQAFKSTTRIARDHLADCSLSTEFVDLATSCLEFSEGSRPSCTRILRGAWLNGRFNSLDDASRVLAPFVLDLYGPASDDDDEEESKSQPKRVVREDSGPGFDAMMQTLGQDSSSENEKEQDDLDALMQTLGADSSDDDDAKGDSKDDDDFAKFAAGIDDEDSD